jgi:hypothetical protein
VTLALGRTDLDQGRILAGREHRTVGEHEATSRRPAAGEQEEKQAMSSEWTAPGQQTSSGDPSDSSADPSHRAWGAGPTPGQDAPYGPGGAPSAPERELVRRDGLFPLRPLGLGQILAAAVGIYRTRPRIVFGLSAIVMGIAWILTTVATSAGMLPSFAGLQTLMDDPEATVTPPFSTATEIVATLVSSAATGLISLVAVQLVTVVLARLTLAEATGAAVPDAELRSTMRSRGVAAVLTAILCSLLAAVPMLIGTLPGAVLLLLDSAPLWLITTVLLVGFGLGALGSIAVWVLTSMSVPALVIEGVGPLTAIRRSFSLTRGRRFWRILGILLLIMVMYTMGQQMVVGVFSVLSFVFYLVILLGTGGSQMVLAMIVLVVLSMIGVFVAMVVLTPFLAASTTTLYLDLRMRFEAYDIDLRRAQAEAR